MVISQVQSQVRQKNIFKQDFTLCKTLYFFGVRQETWTMNESTLITNI